MHNKLLTISLREIKKSYKRFISLMIMSFLGVAVFVGMRDASGVMIASLDKYYDETKLYDIKLLSSYGLTDRDVNKLNNLGLESFGIHYVDKIIDSDNGDPVIRIIGLNNSINMPILNEGKMPTSVDEIVVEKNLLNREKKKIGDYIIINNNENLKNNKFKIVGVVTSPLYILAPSASVTRGTTNIGSGNVNFYTYVSDEVFDIEYYTEVGIRVTNEYITSSTSYNKLINNKLDKVNKIKSELENDRYDEIYNKALDEINKKEQEGIKEFENAEEKLSLFKNELDNAYSKLKSSKIEINDNKLRLSNNLTMLNTSKKEIDRNIELLENSKSEIKKNEEQMEKELGKYNLTISDIVLIKDSLNGKLPSKDIVKSYIKDSEYKEELDGIVDSIYDNYEELMNSSSEDIKGKMKDAIPKDIDNYEEIINCIDEFDLDYIRNNLFDIVINLAKNIEEIKNIIDEDTPYYEEINSLIDSYSNNIDKIITLFDGISALEKGKEEINKNEVRLLNAKNEIEKGFNEYYKYERELKKGEELYNIGYKEYEKSLNLYNSNYAEYLKNKNEFEKKIAEAKIELHDLERPKLYVYTREDDSEYAGYLNIGDSVINLSKAFPTIFFIVAVFMSIMSMSRMAFEDRIEIGTLKSLGFSNFHIIIKYVIYSCSATIIGGLLGSIFGFYFLTWFVYNIYGIMYVLPYFRYYYDLIPFVIGITLSTLCITGTAILTVKKIVNEKPSSLLRPVAPINGKKLLIEHLPLWKRTKFSNKVTIRNIFRYKKRVIMTIVGITGCTVLLLTGYGIKDSITNIARIQFGKIFVFDDIIYLDKSTNLDETFSNSHIKNRLDAKMENIRVGTTSVNLFVPNGDINYDIINLNNPNNNERLFLEDEKVIISDKLSKLYDISVGDKVTFSDINNVKYEVLVNGITENYVGSYIYMNKNTYEKLIGEMTPNVSYIILDDVKNEKKVVNELMAKEEVISTLSRASTIVNVDNMLVSLDKIVYILIILSGALSFVVLYNLSYINISERKREIATLKVLGFTYGEVDNYIIKENFIITTVGIIIGLLMAKPFVNYIVDSIEIDLVEFIHIINNSSYLNTFIYMIAFTSIVSIIIHFTLKKIDMIESLKTVE